MTINIQSSTVTNSSYFSEQLTSGENKNQKRLIMSNEVDLTWNQTFQEELQRNKWK